MPGCSEDNPCVPCYPEPYAPGPAENPMVVMQTSMGDIAIELYAQLSPITVGNFLRYVYEEYYDGLIFHRVIPNFIIQGGQYQVDLQKRTAHDPIPCEADNSLSNKRGTIAMARTVDIHSATSQFFINLKDNPFLDYGEMEFGYAVFGRVINGMNIVDAIGNVETTSTGELDNIPVEPVIIRKIYRQ
jgi:cyclophilin family peptidyl-prolyl cis-trans isomerase